MANTLFYCLCVVFIFVFVQSVSCKIVGSSSSSSSALISKDVTDNKTNFSIVAPSLSTEIKSHILNSSPRIPECSLQQLYFYYNSTNTTNTSYYSFLSNETCNFTVSVDPMLRIVIDIDRFEPDNQILPYVIIDQLEETNTCSTKRIISLPINRTLSCGVDIASSEFRVYVQADVTLRIQLYEVPVEERDGDDCPKVVGLNTKCVNNICKAVFDEVCQSLYSFNEVSFCKAKTVLDPDPIYGRNETIIKCDVTCPPSCICELGAQNIIKTCLNDSQAIILVIPSYPLTDMLTLDFAYMNVSSIKINSFTKFSKFTKLDLSHNRLTELLPGVFNGLENILNVTLQGNELQKLSAGVFSNMNSLNELYLDDNNLSEIDQYAFKGLSSLFLLDMQKNNLTRINAPLFDDLTSMFLLDIKNNYIAELGSYVFRHTKSLILLDISNNDLKEIMHGTFTGLSGLTYLYLSDNKISGVDCGTFSGLTSVTTLTLSNNQIKQIYKHTFRGLSELKYLLLDDNLLRNLESTAFEEIISLKSLDIRLNKLDRINIDAFDGISNTSKILVDNHSVCCFVAEANCIATYPQQVFLTCGKLLPYNVLRVVLSILGSLALIGNAMVLYWRCRIRRRDNKVQFLLIVNLSASDLLMGIYMMILVSSDAHFGERFPLEADMWRRSQICKLAGFLAVLSSEASAFFVTLISIDRLLGVKYPFSRHRLGNSTAKLAIMGVWFLAITLSVVLTLLARIDPDMYALSEVCIGLPMARRWVNNPQNITVALGVGDETVEISETIRTEPGMYLSIAVFLGLNLICFLTIAYCYVVIFITAQKTSRRASRRREKEEEIRMAAKMSVIVVTDFLCWMPIIIIGILVQSGAVTIPPVVYAWIVTFVLPINSSANPFLYTITTIVGDRIGKRPRGSSVDSQCGRKYNGTHYYLTDTYEQILNGHTASTICCESLTEGNV